MRQRPDQQRDHDHVEHDQLRKEFRVAQRRKETSDIGRQPETQPGRPQRNNERTVIESTRDPIQSIPP